MTTQLPSVIFQPLASRLPVKNANYRLLNLATFSLLASLLCACQTVSNNSQLTDNQPIRVSRAEYSDRLHGFWLGQCIANWTGLVTEMDKIGGEGPHGIFYTREDWGTADQPSIWGQGIPSNLSPTITFVFEDSSSIWGSDDDTDIEYIYQHLLAKHKTAFLTAEQIRDGWLTHIYSDQNTPHKNSEGEPENFLWVSNQQAHDLMRERNMLPPATSAPENNPHFAMIDAQLTTEIFGLYAPGRPDTALKMAHLPIRTTARDDAAYAAEFYVAMYALAAMVDTQRPLGPQLRKNAQTARAFIPSNSYIAKMFDFVWQHHQNNTRWEIVRDELYHRYQVEQQDGYDITSQNLYCNGCFAAGINFAASIVSLLYGDGDLKETIKIASLAGWDSDNPAATWGGMIGFILGEKEIENVFEREFSETFNIHRTRTNFPNNGIDTFSRMANEGVLITDYVVLNVLGGTIDTHTNTYLIPPQH